MVAGSVETCCGTATKLEVSEMTATVAGLMLKVL